MSLYDYVMPVRWREYAKVRTLNDAANLAELMTGLLLGFGRPINGNVFICYRRSDQTAMANRLYDKLCSKFASWCVFMDTGSLEPGVDFRQELQGALERCTVLIAIIGPGWLEAADSAGQRRLDDPNDLVRRELEQALEQGMRLIPLLVDGAQMPRPDDLPPSIAPLTRRQSYAISHAHFSAESVELIKTIGRIIKR
jgi:hypothetical protein